MYMLYYNPQHVSSKMMKMNKVLLKTCWGL